MKININNTKIHYKVAGNGNTIVLLHGFSESSKIWNKYTARLSKQYQVIGIDLPGHGKSEVVKQENSMEYMAEIVKNVLDEEEVSKCVMIGHSMGGYVALAFAEKVPALLSGLCLFNSSAAADSEEQKVNRDRTIEVIKANHFNFLSSFIPDLFTAENQEIYKKEISKLIKGSEKMTTEGIISSMMALRNRANRYHVLQDISIPVLFIAGQQDKRVPLDKVLEQISLPKEAHVLLLKEVAHMGYIEASEQTYNAIKNFAKNCF